MVLDFPGAPNMFREEDVRGYLDVNRDLRVNGKVRFTAKNQTGIFTIAELGGEPVEEKIRFDTDGGDSKLRMRDSDDAFTVNIDTDGITYFSGGNVGIDTPSPTNLFSVKEKSGMSTIGGFCIKLTNKTGANSVAGRTVKADTATDDAVVLTAANDDECFGVFLDSGVSDGSEAWVVVSGIADVAMEDNTAATRGNWVSTSNGEAGYGNASLITPAAAPTHFEEIGHCIESVAAGGEGNHILARCVLHFN